MTAKKNEQGGARGTLVLGLMSGTSLDGPDLALVFFPDQNPDRFEIVRAHIPDYPQPLREELRDAHLLPGVALHLLSNRLTALWADEISAFLGPDRPDFVSCSGHTVFHQPHRGLTLQIGNGAMLSALTGLAVVTDFRTADVAMGGQGAPLVPFADPLLFPGFDAWLNIGGIANVTLREPDGRIRAFDICPANMLLNELAARMGHAYDAEGRMARSGRVLPELLTALRSASATLRPTRPSLGREWFEAHIKPLLTGHTPDLAATATEWIATEIATASAHSPRVLITGGGALNTHLVQRIQSHHGPEIILPPVNIIQFKEAVIFAFLGLKRWQGHINTNHTITGSTRSHSAGCVYES